MKNSVNFFLNGKPVTIEDPSPDLLLIDYLRSPEVALSGPKKPCGQGGCGGCTVILSEWDEKKQQPEHRAINSCLRPVCALGGLSITTVEGTGAARKPDAKHLVHRPSSSRAAAPLGNHTSHVLETAQEAAQNKREEVLGSVAKCQQKEASSASVKVVDEVADHPSEHSHTGMNPVAHRLAINNGSQCGYCSVGFVMNMSEFITNNPKATKKEIEDAFDGNLCRCTGYRSILTGMKTFASDWSEKDEEERMKCLEDHVSHAQLPTEVDIPFPKIARQPMSGVTTSRWLTSKTLDELAAILDTYKDNDVRFVHGNTSFGVYKEEYLETTTHVDIRMIPEINTGNQLNSDSLEISASTTYSELIDLLADAKEKLEHTNKSTTMSNISILDSLDYMARRTAGRIVRNAASIGGNTMLVFKHIPTDSGEAFPSDLFTALCAVNAEMCYYELNGEGKFIKETKTAQDLTEAVVKDDSLAHRILLASYTIPLHSANQIAFSQKVALREVNSHSIVNITTNFNIDDDCTVTSAIISLGGIAPCPWRPSETEKALEGEKLTLESAGKYLEILSKEVMIELNNQPARDVPNEGFTNEYRRDLAVSFFYKAIINALIQKGVSVPDNLTSIGKTKWGKWPVSNGIQKYTPQPYKAPVAQPYIKVTAMYQTSGQTHYTHELEVPPTALNAAFVQSTSALKNYHFVIPGVSGEASTEDLRDFLKDRYPEFTDLITYENIKNGGVNYQGMGLDQPLFAENLISYVGQSIAMVLTPNEQDAIKIASYVSKNCVQYSDPGGPWTGKWATPIVELLDAVKKGSIFPDAPKSAPFVAHIWKVTRPGSQFDWTTGSNANPPEKLRRDLGIDTRTAKVNNISCTVVSASQLCGGQVHFYMEPQGCIATPLDEGRMKIQPSVQSPAAMHDTVAMALAAQHNQVEVNVPIVGGGFGGKTEQTRFIAGPTAVAAKATKRPIRLAVPRDEDTAMIGKRHAYYGEYQIAVDNGTENEDNKGILKGFQLKMWGDGGAFYDCSYVVSNCIQLRTDNAYNIPNFESQIDVCRTNKAPNTAMRAFGDVQGKNIVENAIEDAAISLGMEPHELREKNLYDRGDVTPFGQALSYCYMKQVWEYAKDVANFKEKSEAVEAFNKENKWRKRGISLIPVKYGSGYNLLLLEQAAAVVVVNPKDGSVIVHQGGVEIGQGLATQAQQVAAYVLGVPMEMVYIGNANTTIIPNPTSTGGSTGTPYAAEAVKQTSEVMRARIMEYGYQKLKDYGDDWCKDHGIDFWNYGAGEGKGWSTMVEVKGQTKKTMIWQNLTNMAASDRINLIATFNAKIKGGEVQVPVMTFKDEADQPDIPGIERVKDAQLGGGVDSFVGFTYSAACAVTEVDILTGEVKILSADLIYDMGWSMNPAIDIGQVEGAFIQGVGYLMTEKLVSETEGANVGRLNTTNTWRYKIPAITTIPLEMNTFLFPRDDKSLNGIPEDQNLIFSAKEVGEPPLVLANSVFFAIKAAIRASRIERDLDPLFRLDAPATVQEVRRACEVTEQHLAQS